MLRSALFGFKLGRRSLDIACGEAGFQFSGQIHYAEFQILAWKIGELCLQRPLASFCILIQNVPNYVPDEQLSYC